VNGCFGCMKKVSKTQRSSGENTGNSRSGSKKTWPSRQIVEETDARDRTGRSHWGDGGGERKPFPPELGKAYSVGWVGTEKILGVVPLAQKTRRGK